jgi:hypothetical protein
MEILEAPAYIEEFGYTGDMKVLEPKDLKRKVEMASYVEWMKGREWKTILEGDEDAFQGARKEIGISTD